MCNHIALLTLKSQIPNVTSRAQWEADKACLRCIGHVWGLGLEWGVALFASSPTDRSNLI